MRASFARLSSVVSLLLAAAGCAEAPDSRRAPDPAPLSKPRAQAAEPSPPATPEVPPTTATGAFDPQKLTQIIDDPRLDTVKAASLAGDPLKAASELQRVLGSTPAPSADDALRWSYLLGTLRGQGGDAAGAAKAFTDAAATDWPLRDHARFQAAVWLEKAGEHQTAITNAQVVTLPAVKTERTLLLADAYRGLGDVETASGFFRDYLRSVKSSGAWVPVALRYARFLLAKPSEAHAEEAAQLARRVLDEGGGYGAGDAKEIEQAALSTLPFAKRSRFEHPTTDELIERTKDLLASAQYKEALRITDGLIKTQGFDKANARSCEAWILRGESLGKLRKRPEAADAFGKAIARCTGQPRRVHALFAGGRASQRASRPPEAISRFALVEKEFANHSYADDARLQAARAALEMGDDARYAQLLGKLPDDYPNGDMVNDGLFELALRSIEEGEWAKAIPPLERAAARVPRERTYATAGRLPYFLARARIESGAREQGIETLSSIVRDYPLSFYMTLAYARLTAIAPDVAERVLTEAVNREPDGLFVLGDDPGLRDPAFIRAVELAKQGELKLVRAELDELGVTSRKAPSVVLWASAFVLARVGAAKESHSILRGAAASTGTGDLYEWPSHYPKGRWRAAWELAYPKPFADVVSRETKRANISEAFAYAIMREESAFDPRVMSPARAFGLMQLIVPTAARMAKPLGLPADEESLKKPEVNVALGCRYLAQLRGQFTDTPLLAIPGYNAGSGAPKKWLLGRQSDDFDLFVERIPYDETRNYTKRVIGTLAAYEFLYGQGAPSEALRLPIALRSPTKTAPVASGPQNPTESDDGL